MIGSLLLGCAADPSNPGGNQTGGETGSSGGSGGASGKGGSGGSSGSGGSASGGSQGSGGGAGGSSAGGASGSDGASSGGSGGSEADAAAGGSGGSTSGKDASGADSAAPSGDAGAHPLKPDNPMIACKTTAKYRLPGISPTDFCDFYEAYCPYDPSVPPKRIIAGTNAYYASYQDCIDRYTKASEAAKTCRAGQLCGTNYKMGQGCTHASGHFDTCM